MKPTRTFFFLVLGALCCMMTQPVGAQVIQETGPLQLFSNADDTAADVMPVEHCFSSQAACDTTCDGNCDAYCTDTPCDVMGSCGAGKPKCNCCLCRKELTGNWRGIRSCFAEHGVIYKASITQFYQGVASGGAEQVFRYGGKIDQYFIFDSEKLGGWKGGKLIMHADSQIGENSIADAALLAPVNSAMLTPLPTERITAITHFQYEQELGAGFSATVGKFNFLDLWAALYPEYGRGLDGFMNTSMVAPLNVVPTLPVIFNATGLLKANKKGITAGLMAIDPQETQTFAGLDRLYNDGVSILALARVFTEFGGLPGSHLIAGNYSTRTYTEFDPVGWLVLPPGISVVPLLQEEEGSWLAAYVGQQRLWQDRCNEKRKVKLWGYAGFSDPETSPFDWTMSVSLEAFGLNRNRVHDRMGIGYFYTGISDPLKNTIPALGLRDLQGGEFYYNAEITPWFHLTGDLQAVQTEIASQDTAVVLGVRAKIDL